MESTTLDGGAMTLYEHDDKYCISYSGQELMHSGASASEISLGEIGVERLDRDAESCILIGGLGLGFYLARCAGKCRRCDEGGAG